jgi:hypothetical protein
MYQSYGTGPCRRVMKRVGEQGDRMTPEVQSGVISDSIKESF